jgi:hypothetical protein
LLKFRYIVEELTGDIINSANAWLLISTVGYLEKFYFFGLSVKFVVFERQFSQEQGEFQLKENKKWQQQNK